MKLLLLFFILCFIFRNFKRVFYKPPNTTGNYLLLIAHPDDESMFFAPTLLNLKGKIKIICLSKGDTLLNFDRIREMEMTSICKNYNFKLQMYPFLDNENWDPNLISEILFYNYLLEPFTTLITFDKCGVSGHKNHISCFEAAKLFSNKIKIKTMYLKSLNTFQKYLCNYRFGKMDFILGINDYFTVCNMMTFHKSQLLWFRYLYLIFSSYTSYNTF